MAYGVEIWGCEEEEELEKVIMELYQMHLQIKFLPRCIIYRELVMAKMKLEWGQKI